MDGSTSSPRTWVNLGLIAFILAGGAWLVFDVTPVVQRTPTSRAEHGGAASDDVDGTAPQLGGDRGTTVAGPRDATPGAPRDVAPPPAARIEAAADGVSVADHHVPALRADTNPTQEPSSRAGVPMMGASAGCAFRAAPRC